MMESKIVDYALKYRSLGFSVIPCIPPTKDKSGKDIKKPRIEWTPYCKKKATKEEIISWFQKWPDSRIGIVTGPISNIFVVDIDEEEARQKLETEYIPENLITPIACSPRGGYHYYFEHQLGLRNKTHIDGMGLDTRGEGGFIMAPPSNGLNGANYRWMPGLEIDKVKIAPLPPRLYNYIINSFNTHVTDRASIYSSPQVSTLSTNVNEMFEYGRRDDDLFHTANCLVKGGMPEMEIRQVIEKLIISWGENPDKKWINAKVDSALKRSHEKSQNISEEVRELILSTTGTILSTWIFNSLQVSTRQGKKAVYAELSRLVDQEIIERTGRRAGEYRIKTNHLEIVDLNNVEIKKGLDINLPFFIEHYVEIMPKDLIVFAGEPNSGKTAIMLDVVRMNMRRFKCWYFSTEMGRYNAKKRIMKHDNEGDWNFKFVDDIGDNYYDIIKPDDFNFIDYVEVTEGREFYDIPKILAGIQKKLKNGVALVALQKLPGKDHGVGGAQTLAKPALFCSLIPDYPGAKMKIVKAKNYIDSNPNGWVHRFKIIKGINILPEGSWEPEM